MMPDTTNMTPAEQKAALGLAEQETARLRRNSELLDSTLDSLCQTIRTLSMVPVVSAGVEGYNLLQRLNGERDKLTIICAEAYEAFMAAHAISERLQPYEEPSPDRISRAERALGA